MIKHLKKNRTSVGVSIRKFKVVSLGKIQRCLKINFFFSGFQF